jgi:hypothetical protein
MSVKKEYENPEWFKQGAVVRITGNLYNHGISIGSIVEIEEVGFSMRGFLKGYVREVPYSEEYWIMHQECEPVEIKSVEELLG